MKNIIVPLLSGLVLISTSCGTSGASLDAEAVRTATGVPDLFEPPVGMSWGDNKCKNPIIDPVDGTELILVQSLDGMGDYRIEGNKYGVGKDELLRINCFSGAVVGIVRR